MLSSSHWLCPFQRLYAEDIRRCNYLMDQWPLSWYAIDFLNHEVRQSRAEVDQNVSALLEGLFPHVFASSMQGRINQVEKILGIFSLQQAEKKNYLSELWYKIIIVPTELPKSLENDIEKHLGMNLATSKNEWTLQKIYC